MTWYDVSLKENNRLYCQKAFQMVGWDEIG